MIPTPTVGTACCLMLIVFGVAVAMVLVGRSYRAPTGSARN